MKGSISVVPHCQQAVGDAHLKVSVSEPPPWRTTCATTIPHFTDLEHLVVSRHTVRTHLQHIYGKWDVPDRAATVAEAFRQGLID